MTGAPLVTQPGHPRMAASGYGENHCAGNEPCRHEGLFMTSWSVGDFGYSHNCGHSHIVVCFPLGPLLLYLASPPPPLAL